MSFPRQKLTSLENNLTWIMIGLLFAFLFLFYSQYVDAARENTDIGITLSKTCITMLKNNFTTSCPTYEQILTLFPDTSNQNISGKFIYDDDGFLYRDNTNFKSHFGFYTYEPNTLWVDPPGDLVGRIATITIEPRLNDYLIQESNKMENNTIAMGHSIWVNDLCYRATVGADDWILKTGQIIQYLDHDCAEEYKTFDNVRYVNQTKSYQDITTSYKYQLDKWIAETKVNCLIICKEY